MTDNTFDFPIYYEQNLLTDAMTENLSLTRYAIVDGQPDKSKPAMTTDAGMVFIRQGVTNWVVDSTNKTGLQSGAEFPHKVTVKAQWLSATEALKENATAEDMMSSDTTLPL